MLTHMLARVIQFQFETSAGKFQSPNYNIPPAVASEARAEHKALHVEFDLNPKGGDEYRLIHMYIFAPLNYVYVAVLEERINSKSQQVFEPMQVLSYHDSGWRDAVEKFIDQNRDDLCVFKPFNKSWYEVAILTPEEEAYLDYVDSIRRQQKVNPILSNPFEKRGMWS